MAFKRLTHINALFVLAAACVLSASAQENRDPGDVAACLPQKITRPKLHPLSAQQVCRLVGAKDIRGGSRHYLRQDQVTAEWSKSRPRSAASRSKTVGELWKEFEDGKVQDLELAQELARLERLYYQDAAIPTDPQGKILTPGFLLTQAEKIRTNLDRIVSTHPHTSPESKRVLRETLAGVRVLNYEAAARSTDPDERKIILSTLRERCGPTTLEYASTEYIHRGAKVALRSTRDFPALQLSDQANIKQISAVILCPRALTLVQSQEVSLFPYLQWILAHELGHGMTITAGENANDDTSSANTVKRLSQASLLIHAPYLSCMQEEFGSGIPSLEELYRQTLFVENTNPEQDYIVSQIRSQKRIARETLAWTPLGIESHSKELVADYWAARWVARFGLPSASSQLAPFLGGTFSHFCFMEEKIRQIEGIPSGEEGVHPSNQVRMHVILSQPEVQRALRKARVPLPDLPSACGL